MRLDTAGTFLGSNFGSTRDFLFRLQTLPRVNKRKQKPISHPREISASKQRWFVIFTLAFPIILLLFVELILKAIDYGPDLSLFTTEEIGGRTYHIMNPDVKGRYFSRVAFSPNTSPDYFEVPKPKGTFRIFCLGGSTTVGYPYSYVGSFSTFLRDRLNRLFPERRIEVINLGMTATNSYTVVDLAKELVDYEPDMFCVYDGHNEFYGALGIASHESITASRWLTKLYLRLVRVRTFLFLRDLYGLLGGLFHQQAADEPSGTMMERLARGRYIAYGSTEYNTALDSFRANLNELRSICTQNNIYLLVGSQVSNLRDQPPFVTQDSPHWSQQEKLQFHLTFNRGIAHLLNGLPDSALREFDRAMLFDSLRADLRYQRGGCLDSLGLKRAARTEYEKARDFDMLRFRASSDFNNALHQIEDGQRVFFVDIERKFRANSPDSLIGNNLILEHLHPNARGYFLIAKEFTWPMHRNQILADEKTWNERDCLDDDKLWSDRPLTELDSICAHRRTDLLTSGWPFRPDTKTIPPPPPEDTLGTIAAEMVEGRITWEQGHVAAASLFETRSQLDKAEKEYRALVNQIPVNVSAYLKLGQAYLRQGKNEEAAGILLASTRVEQTPYANRTLGMLALHPKDAIPFFEKALALSGAPNEKTEIGFLLADAYNREGSTDRAVTQLQQVLQWTPNFPPARNLLQQITTRR
jgi:tetratricopeptide (TPR) repeat protein